MDRSQLFFKELFDRFSDQEFISKENKLILKFTKPYRTLLKSKGVSHIRFSDMLKDHTKKKNVPKNSIYYGIFNIIDFFELLYYLYSRIGCVEIVKCRCISSRASYYDKDIVLTFFAIEFPYIMLEVPKDNFSKFTFCRKIYRKDELTEKWNACIFNLHIQIRAFQSNENQQGQPVDSQDLHQQDPQPENTILISNNSNVSFNNDTDLENYNNQMPSPSSPTDMFYAHLEVGNSTAVDHEIFRDELNDQQYSIADEADISDANDFGPAFEYLS